MVNNANLNTLKYETKKNNIFENTPCESKLSVQIRKTK
uniref:Uncharacterized protein n=1 Tax=Lepeophtheirus salmonis TaxID=72036 RepID=A0A0K2TWX9_LEPSM